MQCRNCGTEIADKALICYRCGGHDRAKYQPYVPVKRPVHHRHRHHRGRAAGLARVLLATLQIVTPATPLRHDWSLAEIEAIYTAPLPDLVFRAQSLHRAHHRPDEVQGCMLLSIKTGGCPEDCAYCPQSAHYKTGVTRGELVSIAETDGRCDPGAGTGRHTVLHGRGVARRAGREQFDQVLEMVRTVRGLGMEACVTLGMLTQEQADALADAGLTAYATTSTRRRSFYGSIITTRTYSDGSTFSRVRKAGVTVCCGGIIGMGEDGWFATGCFVSSRRSITSRERAGQPARSRGRHAAGRSPGRGSVQSWCRRSSAAHPDAGVVHVRLSAGRLSLTDKRKRSVSLAGANSVHLGERLRTPNPGVSPTSICSTAGHAPHARGAPAGVHAGG
jgi:biotin synthase